MAAKIEFDPALGAVVSCSEDAVTRDSMREAIRRITGELAANDCQRLLVDVMAANVQVSIADMTFILDQLLTSTHGDLRMALILPDSARPHGDFAHDYLSAEHVEVELFRCPVEARRWIAA